MNTATTNQGPPSAIGAQSKKPEPPSEAKVLEYRDEKHAESLEGMQLGEFGYKFRMLEGRVMPPFVTPNRYNLSRRLKTRPSDICFASYPKSGTTWLSYILVLMTNQKGATLQDSSHWVESNWTYVRSEEELDKAPDPRIFKSHMPYDMALGGIPAQNECRYIYIARNPKDVCVSYFHFEKEKSWSGYYTGDWNHWFDMFINGKTQRGDWFHHALSWWENRDSKNILFLKYEDLKQDIDTELRKIADFIDVEVTADRLDEIKEKISFSKMQSDDFSSLNDVKELNKFFRKGESGSWKDQFSVRQNEIFDKICAERLGKSGLTFDCM